jgi:hypothetical protein
MGHSRLPAMTATVAATVTALAIASAPAPVRAQDGTQQRLAQQGLTQQGLAQQGLAQQGLAQQASVQQALVQQALADRLAQAPAPAEAPASAVKPYKAVAITLPPPLNDPSFDAFRKQLGEIAQKKDRAALDGLVAPSFFWVPEDADLADKGKPATDNMAKALNLNGKDAPGWDALAAYAMEPSAMADPQRAGVFCAPAEPSFDDKAADDLANATQTDASDWAFPLRDGIEVRTTAKPDSPVVDKLGLYLVRVLADDSPANAVLATSLKVVTPSGKVGYVPVETLLPIGGEQLCYLKDASGWKIAGFLGGEPNQ